MVERGHRTVYRSQSRRHPQRRDLQRRAAHAKNCRTSSETFGYERKIKKTTHLRTTFSVRRSWRKFMKQATASYMKFSKELTKYNVNVVTRTLRLDFKYVHAENCRKKSSPASDKNLSNSLPMRTWHSKEREEPSMVFSHGKSIAKKNYEKDPQERNLYVDSWPLTERWSLSC